MLGYDANGLEISDWGRVKYDLEVDGDNRTFTGKAPELIKIQLATTATNVFFDTTTSYTPVAFDPSTLDHIYSNQIFLDVDAEKNFTWTSEALVGDCLTEMEDYINNPS